MWDLSHPIPRSDTEGINEYSRPGRCQCQDAANGDFLTDGRLRGGRHMHAITTPMISQYRAPERGRDKPLVLSHRHFGQDNDSRLFPVGYGISGDGNET